MISIKKIKKKKKKKKSADPPGSATAIFLPKGFSTPHQKSHDNFWWRLQLKKIERTTSTPPSDHAVFLWASGYYLHSWHLACTLWCCLPLPPLKCTVFEFYGCIFHSLQFLSPREVLHTLWKVTGLSCYFYSLLLGHSFVVALLPMAPLLSLKPPPPPAPPGPSPGAPPVLSGLSPGTSHHPYSPGASYLSPSCSLERESLPLQLPSSLQLTGSCSPLLGLCPISFWSVYFFSPGVGGFILAPRLVFFCSNPWPIGLTRHCAWRRMERGGVGVGGGFPFTFWLVHFNVLALSSPFFAQRPSTPRFFQLWWVFSPPAASHCPPCYCTIYRSGLRL